MNKNYRILIISSISPDKSANLGGDIVEALEKKGNKVDFLTRYKTSGENVYSILDEVEPVPQVVKPTFMSRLKKRFPFLKFLHRPVFFKKKINLNGYVIVNEDEKKPPISTDLVVDSIKKEYDFVIVLFWQYMMTTQTLKSVYEKLQVPIFILAVDMFPLTGGCYYFRNCNRFLDSCGKCPGVGSNNPYDFTHKNFNIKKDIYESINCLFLGNSWMNNYVISSPLFRNKPVMNVILPINEKVFKSFSLQEKNTIKEKLGIPPSKKFILFAGAAHPSLERKGFSYLIKSINLFSAKLTVQNCSEILLILAGNTVPDINELLKIEVMELGYLELDSLSYAYNICDLFLSPSVEDAGPTMVNQSIMSGTPVVSFDIGVAQDIVICGETGYRAKLKDVEDFTRGINYIYNLSEEEREKMSLRCREIAMEKYSLNVFASKIEKIFQSITE